MATMLAKTKNNVSIDKKPRVYFTCHPDDFVKYFGKICDDIFKTHDCVIYYTADMREAIPADEQETDLGRNNLFVVPVTYKLLTTPSRAMDEDIPYALKEHIPVLPIMMEPDLDSFYSQPNKFGELQYLNPNSMDATEISYQEKLKKHLESVLISDKLAKRVRSAFDAYIFLSYRKKDRKYANQLMRLIHQNPECRDIAIWFDEFLTPGESFKENIEKMLDDCKLFTLLVTPQLLEKVVDESGVERDNYVLSTELPMARRKKAEKGTDIFAVEMEDTNPDALSSLSIEDYVNHQDEAFRTRLLESISKMAITTNDTPEHNFLIGLAYLEGIDVEVNRELGLELVTQAAQNNLPEAMYKLYRMYTDGVGISLDYQKALLWAKAYADYMVIKYGEEHAKSLSALGSYALAYGRAGKFKEALEIHQKVYDLYCKTSGEEATPSLTALGRLASAYDDVGNFQKALELKEKVYAMRSRLLGEEHLSTLTSLNNLAVVYNNLGMYAKALEAEKKTYGLRCRLLGEEHPDTLITLGNMASSYRNLGEHNKALETIEQVYELCCKTLGEEHPQTVTAMSVMGLIHNDLGNHQKAEKFAKKAYEIRLALFGAEHPRTLIALVNLAAAYGDLGDHQKALELQTQVYELRCKLLGEEHPRTLNALNNMASSYRSLGEHQKALELKQKVYELRSKVLGEEHPSTLVSLNNLASTYSDLGNYQKAMELETKVYTLRCKSLGEEHPKTLTALSCLALYYCNLEQYEKALELQTKVYGLQCKVLGEEHPKTLRSLHVLASYHDDVKDYQNAIRLAQKAYTLRCKVLGEEHSSTQVSLADLALYYKYAKEYTTALALYEKLYAIRVKTLGMNHVKTLRIQNRIKELRKILGE